MDTMLPTDRPDTTRLNAENSGPCLMFALSNGFAVRYVLQTDLLPRLAARGAAVVVVVSPEDCDRVSGMVPRGVTVFACPPPPKFGRIERYFQAVRNFLYADYVCSAEEIYKRIVQDVANRPAAWSYRLLKAVAGGLAIARPLRQMVPRLEEWLFPAREFIPVLEQARPDLVIVTGTGTMGFGGRAGRAAARLGLRVVNMILSWDNTTTKGYPGCFGTAAVAWSETMKRELCELLDYRPEQVAVKGIAHFDVYHRPDPGFDRAGLLAALGLDPAKRTVVLGTKSPNSYACNAEIAELLAEAMADGRLPDCQLVIRPHPIHYRRDPSGDFVYGETLAAYEALVGRYPHVVVNELSVVPGSALYLMGGGEMMFLSRLLRASDVLVNMFSTLNIEAALLDKPLVNVCFELGEGPGDNVRSRSRYNIHSDAIELHNQRIVDSGGTRLAYSPDELIEHVAAYLRSPDLDREGRQRIADREGGPFKGNAGPMIADYILYVANRP